MGTREPVRDYEALPQGRLHMVLFGDARISPVRWLDNLRRMNFLRLSHEKAKYQ